MRDRGAASIYVVMSGASSLFYRMIFVVEVFYQIKTVGLNPLQLVLVGTLWQSISFLCQAPTGILADMYSRRWAVVLGFFLVGAGFLIEGSFSVFAAVLAAQVLSALGGTLVNGADAAWIADELDEDRVGTVYLHAAQVGSIAGLLGIAISTGLATVRLNLPIVLAGGAFVALSIVLALVMPERHFTPTPREERTSWQHMGYTLRASLRVVRRRPVLRTILGIGAFYGVFGAGFDRLWPYHLQHTITFPTLGGLTPVIWFGLIEAGITVTNFCGTAIVGRCVDTTSHRAVAWTLCTIDGLTIVGVAAFAVAGQFGVALAVFFLITTALGPRVSLEQAWMNRNLDSAVRATVFSLRGQVGALAGIIGGPILGAIATAFTTRAALIATAVILTPTLLLYIRIARHDTALAASIAAEAHLPTSSLE
jgi:DHA3 family tetracycline resistance protein-like MFS transporter